MNRIKLAILTAVAIVPAATALVASAAGPNMLQNGAFATDLAGWQVLGGASHSQYDGTLKLVNDYAGNGNSYYSVIQCVKNIDDLEKYTVTGDAYVADGQPKFGAAGLYLNFNTGANCDGSNMGGGHTGGGYTDDQRGKWLDLEYTVQAPAGAKSVTVRPAAIKEPIAPADAAPGTLTVFFDNLTFKKADLPIVMPPTATPTPTQVPDGPDDITDAPDTDPTPGPTVAPEQPPVDQPVDEPADQPADKPAVDSGTEPVDAEVEDDEPTVGSNTTPAANEPAKKDTTPASAPSKQPLPPSTGEGEAVSDNKLPLVLASAASMVAGLGIIAGVVLRKRREV